MQVVCIVFTVKYGNTHKANNDNFKLKNIKSNIRLSFVWISKKIN